MKRARTMLVAGSLLAMAAVATAQDLSDPIYDENVVASIQLTMAATDWDKIVNDPYGQGELYQRCTFNWQGEVLTDVAVKVRGFAARRVGNPKPSLTLKFDEFIPGRDFRGVDALKLDGLRLDYSMLRERLAYWTYRQMGAGAPRAVNARVWVNGNLLGVYEVEEPIRKAFARRRWNIANPDGNLYEISLYDANNQGRPTNTDHYLWRGPTPATYVPSLWMPKTNEIGGNYQDVVDFLNPLNSGGAQRWTLLDGKINLDSFLAYLATTTGASNFDSIFSWGVLGSNTPNNHFWYHRDDTDRLEIVAWDVENAFGNQYFTSNPPTGVGTGQYRTTQDIWFGFNSTVATSWIQGDATANAALRAKVQQYLNGPLSAAAGRADFIYNQIKNHVYADPNKPQTNAQFDAEVQNVKDWIGRRINYLRSQFPSSVDDAAFVSQSVPSTMTAGQTYPVTVTFSNSGTTSWTTAGNYALTSRNSQGNLTWGLNRVDLPSSVAPNASVTFSFTVTAPATAGTYNFMWSLMRNGTAFGATSTNIAVTVTGAAPPPPTNGATFVSQTVPSTMTAGQTYTVSVTMRNTGTSTWTDAAPNPHRLGSQNPVDNITWGMNRVPMLAGSSIGPNQTVTFTWDVVAPQTPGTFNFQWQMRQSGVDWFGDLTPNVAVTVTVVAPPPPTNGATFVSQAVPPTMTAGQTYTVSVTMQNTGTTTWTDAGSNPHRLGSQNPADNATWGMNRVSMPTGSSIAPNQTVTFTWDVVAPLTAGTYNFQWQMRQSGVEWFGPLTPNVAVVVTAALPPPPTNQPPVISIASPAGGTTFTVPASVTISANASDSDGTVTRVEFFQGGTLLGQDTNGADGWSFVWSNVAAGTYTLTARAMDDDGDATISVPVSITVQAAGGAILREFWLGLGLGTTVADLTSSPNYPGNPSGSEQRTIFEGPVDTTTDGYGARMRGYVMPPTSGAYVFVISSNAQSELWLSTDESPFTKRRIAWVPDRTLSREWTKYPEQSSPAILLEAGRRYYIEALHKDDAGSDHLAVGWTLPDGTPEQPIPGTRLSMPFIDLRDNDGDGIVNDQDPDDDNDGTPDESDPDRDGDGVTNDAEVSLGTDPDDGTSVPSAAALAGRENANGDGGFLANDKCAGSVGAGHPGIPSRLATLSMFALLVLFGFRRASR